MSLVAVGLSHHTSPVELRERLHFPEAALPKALMRLRNGANLSGAVILSTCNRVEIYASAQEPAPAAHENIRRFLGTWHGIVESDYRNALYEFAERETAGHLFRVASSLDSLVVGEQQILGQVHDAYLASQAEQCVDKLISGLFQKAFSIGKQVRSQTHITAGKVSIGSVAVDLAVSIFMELEGKTVMVIGSGKMGEVTLRNLVSRGVEDVLLVNRSEERALELAGKVRGEVVPFERLEQDLHRADIVISSTAAPEPILGAREFQHALRRRGNAPVIVIDIAVPRNVEPDVKRLDNVYLYDVDDLRHVAEANLEARRQEVDRAMQIVEAGVDQFWSWMQGLAAESTILSIAEGIHALRARELEKVLAALPDLDGDEKEIIAAGFRRFANAVLHQPTVQLKREVAHHDPHTVLHLVKRLFGLKETP